MNTKHLLRNAAAVGSFILASALVGLAPIPEASANTVIVDQDIDLFLGSSTGTCNCANVLLIIDNASNWHQTYAPADGSGNTTRQATEITALTQVINALPSSLNVGIEMGTESGNDPTFGASNGAVSGANIRFAVRPLNATNKAAMVTFLNGLAGSVEDSSPSGYYTMMLHEAYRYFAGLPLFYSNAWGTLPYPPSPTPNSPQLAGVCTTKCGNYNTTTSGSSYYPPYQSGGDSNDPAPGGQVRTDDGTLYFGTGTGVDVPINMHDNGAFTTGPHQTPHVYQSPDTTTCSKNYIIFVSNGTVNLKEDTNPTQSNQFNAPDTLAFDGVSTTPVITLGTDSLDSTHSYSGGVNGQQQDPAPAMARFMYGTNVNTSVTPSNVVTYTVNPWPASPQKGDYDQEIYLQAIASAGHGKYFRSNGVQSLVTDLTQIFSEIAAVNSVFAAAALPVNAAMRGTNLNQVYLGVFRPDSNVLPRWYGNLKEYQIGVNAATNTLVLEDSVGNAADNPSTGFITPSAVSFWTTASTFWSWRSSTLNGTGGSSDSPDGDLVEKGAEAEWLRNTYATTQSSRPLYTCTGSCTSGSLLSATPFSSSNAALTQAALGTTSATDTTNLIAWVQGTDNYQDENGNGSFTDVRASIHGDVLHSIPGVIDYNRGNSSNDVYVFYGANDGVFHAIQGANGTTAGKEIWGFIPQESFSQLNALRADVGPLSITNPKPYFMDGPVTAYTLDSNNDQQIDPTVAGASGDKAYIYLTAHRGGSMIYALDVSIPTTPKLLWNINSSTTGFSELGQTWSQIALAPIKASTNPVAIFGGGYDNTDEDQDPAATDTKGRAIYVVDAYTGALLWEAGPSPSGAPVNLTVSGMTSSIPSSLVLYDSNQDGFVDRAYVGDTGGNIWRLDIGDANPANWKVTKLASLGGTGTNARKFLFAPDIVFNNDATGTYDAVLIGSGDREHPFNTTVVNRFYMIKDTHAMSEPTTFTTITEANLFDATSDILQTGTSTQQAAAQVSLAGKSGWLMTFQGSGEKDAGGDLAIEGSVIFNTYSPTTATTSCTSSLGTATQYIVSYKDATATINLTGQSTMTINDRSQNIAGGGFVPTPVHVAIVLANGTIANAALSGTNLYNFNVASGWRLRTHWKKTGGQ